MADLLAELKQSQPVNLLDELQQIPPVQEQQRVPELQLTGGLTAIIPDAITDLLATSFGTIVGGAAGAGALTVGDAETAEQIRQGVTEELTIPAKTEGGKALVDAVNFLGEKGIEISNKALSGLIGISALATGQTLEAATQQQKSVEEEGFSNFLAESLLEAGAPPEVAAFVKGLPAAILTRFGIKQKIGPVTSQKQLLAERVRKGSTDVETAKLTTEQPRIGFEEQPLLPAPDPGVPGGQARLPQPPRLKVVADKLSTTAIKQGFDEGVIAAVKQSTPATKRNLLKMSNIKKAGIKNRRFEARNRPSDVVGDAVLKRFNVVKAANKRAGRNIDIEARKLKGQQVDPTEIGTQFIDDLQRELGVTLDDNLKAVFRDSDIEFSPRAKKVINNVIEKITRKQAPDALDLHKIKRFIDEQVTFGKSLTGSLGRTENVLKSLRRNIDGLLDEQFPAYDKVNSVYAETIDLLNEFQSIAGKNIDLLGKGKGVGVLMRRVLSNATSRDRIQNIVDNIESVARKHGGKFDDDLLDQVIFMNELDNRFGASAKTSFQGQIEQAIPTSKADLALKAAGKLTERFKGINNEAAFKAIEELLKRGSQ